eukprot:m.338979 g.338979  ORF g.338979 m.338979 type:complete len:85 (+) comp131580_c0_seq1:182-436(+)
MSAIDGGGPGKKLQMWTDSLQWIESQWEESERVRMTHTPSAVELTRLTPVIPLPPQDRGVPFISAKCVVEGHKRKNGLLTGNAF